ATLFVTHTQLHFFSFSLSRHSYHLDLLSFPTRRSSDLASFLSCRNRMHGISPHRKFLGAGFVQRSGERKYRKGEPRCAARHQNAPAFARGIRWPGTYSRARKALAPCNRGRSSPLSNPFRPARHRKNDPRADHCALNQREVPTTQW